MIKPIRNRQVVEDFMAQPEIYRYAAPHGAGDSAIFTSDNPQEFWLGFYVLGDLAGVFKVSVLTGSMAEVHQYMVREYKHKYLKAGLLSFSWMKSNMPPELLKINACVPVIFHKTIDILKEGGMNEEGLDTLSYRHEGGVCDRVLLGIKVADIK